MGSSQVFIRITYSVSKITNMKEKWVIQKVNYLFLLFSQLEKMFF